MELDHLNPSQRAAVAAPAGFHLVVAGAGTGKTRTLVHRVAWLLEQKVDPRGIVLLTFTRRAATEMLQRASQLVGGAAHRVRGGTFHGFAHGVLRRHGEAVGIGRNFTVLDRGDASDLVGLVRTELGLGGRGRRRFPQKNTLLKLLSASVNRSRSITDVVAEDYPWFSADAHDIERIAVRYRERKLEQQVVDYDDLLVLLDCLLREHKDARREIADGCQHLLVDEYQDTNRLQGRIAALLSVRHRSLMVVGDEAQSIYAFRGATVENILRFPQVFSGASVTVLEDNYRSTQPILDLANGILASARDRYDKTLRSHTEGGQRPQLVELGDETEQPGWMVERILALREEGVSLQKMAVLFRSAWHANLLEIELSRANIPYRKFGGLQFLEAAHVKDILALLRVVANPRDALAWYRVLQWFDGIGRRTAQRILEAVQKATPPTLDPEPWEKKRYGADLFELAGVIEGLGGLRRDVPALVDAALRWFLPRLPSLYDDSGKRARDLDTLPTLAHGHQDLDRFLAEVSLDPPASVEVEAEDAEDEWITLSTVHSAKGLEWHSVFVMGLCDGHFPSGYSLDSEDGVEEERRLLYVAVTRAERNLFLLAPRVVQQRGQTGLGHGCLLLDDVPELDSRVERLAAGRPTPDASELPPLPTDDDEEDFLAAILDHFD